MLVMRLSALDATIPATALPTIVAELGGIERIGGFFTAGLMVTDRGCDVFSRLSTARRERLAELSAQWPGEQRAEIAAVLRGLARALVPATPAQRG